MSANAEARSLLKLDLGCGQIPKEGFLGVDLHAKGALKIDLSVSPWWNIVDRERAFDDNSVAEVHCSHFLEHLSGQARIEFINELHRVLVPGGVATIIVPYAWSSRAMQDWTHQWPPIVEAAFMYFNKKWREDQKLDHYYPTNADFTFEYGHSIGQIGARWAQRTPEVRANAVTNYINVVDDLHVKLTKTGGPEVDKRG